MDLPVDPPSAASALTSATSPSIMDRLKQQQVGRRATRPHLPVDETTMAAVAHSRRVQAFLDRTAEPGNMDEEMYKKVAWGLGGVPASSAKDRLARAWDATVASLNFNHAGLTHREVSLLAHGLTWNDALTSLDLGWCDLDVPAVATLCGALQSNGTLQSLRLWNNPGVGDEGAAHLSGLLKLNTVINALDLSVTGITEAGAGYLNSSLQRNTSLTNLVLSRNALGDAGVNRLLHKKTGSMIALRSLSLRCVNMTDESVPAVAAFAHDSFSITALDLSSNALRYPGMDILGEALSINKTVMSLDLSNCGFGAAGAITLSSHLTNCRYLKDINVAMNNIADEGVRALCSVLHTCNQLHTLDLSDNGLTATSGKQIGYLLRLSPSLRCLRLTNNKLGFVGAVDIAESLRPHGNLAELDISRNEIGRDGASRFAYVMQRNPRLKTWYVNLLGLVQTNCSL